MPFSLVTPTSITTASFLTSFLPINSFDPVATTKISAFLVKSVKLVVLEWHTVTVAFSFKNKLTKGLPTNLDLPTIHTFLPSISTSYYLSSLIIPAAVHGTIPSLLLVNLPTLISFNPSTSLLLVI